MKKSNKMDEEKDSKENSMRDGNHKKYGSAREIDKVAGKVSSWWGNTYVYVTKTKVQTWKGALLLAFFSGLAFATVWGVSSSYFQGSLAGTATSLFLDTGEVDRMAKTVQVGDTFDLDAVIDTDDEDVVAVKAMITYDETRFSLDSIDTSGSIFAVGNNGCQYQGRACEIIDRDDANGSVAITLAKPSPGINTGTGGVIATLTFTALSETTPSSDNFSFVFSSFGNYADSDMIADDGAGTDTLDNVVGASVTVTTVPPPACDSFVYSDFGACQPNNTQTRTVTSSLPTGCTGGIPTLSQGCVFDGGGGDPDPVVTCTNFTYSGWSTCNNESTQSRTVTGSSPANCAGGEPELEQSCIPGGDSDPDPVVVITDKDRPIKVEGDKKSFGKKGSFYTDDKSVSFQGGNSDIANGKIKILEDGDVKKEITVGADGNWKGSYKVKKDGSYKFKVAYFDSNGAQVAESSEQKVKVDTTDPKFTDLPLALTKKRGEKIWWKADDGGKIDYFKVSFLGKKKETGKYSFNIPADAPRGVHILKVQAVDKAGNTATRRVTIFVK